MFFLKKNRPTSVSFSFIFGLFKQTVHILQQIIVKMCIQSLVLGFDLTTFWLRVSSLNQGSHPLNRGIWDFQPMILWVVRPVCSNLHFIDLGRKPCKVNVKIGSFRSGQVYLDKLGVTIFQSTGRKFRADKSLNPSLLCELDSISSSVGWSFFKNSDVIWLGSLWELSSVTRFGKISPFWQNIQSLGQTFEGIFSIWQNF